MTNTSKTSRVAGAFPVTCGWCKNPCPYPSSAILSCLKSEQNCLNGLTFVSNYFGERFLGLIHPPRSFLKNTVPTTTTTNTCKSRLMLVYLLTKTQETRHRNHKRIESTGLDYNISIPFFLTLLTSIRFTLNIQH